MGRVPVSVVDSAQGNGPTGVNARGRAAGRARTLALAARLHTLGQVKMWPLRALGLSTVQCWAGVGQLAVVQFRYCISGGMSLLLASIGVIFPAAACWAMLPVAA
jgi:hypothetical protein